MLCEILYEKMAGAVGFEPTIHDTKNRCLTTWPRPNPIGCCNLASKSRAIKPVLAPMTRKMRLICRMLWQIMVKCHQPACLPAIIWLVLSNIRLVEILCRRLWHQLNHQKCQSNWHRFPTFARHDRMASGENAVIYR